MTCLQTTHLASLRHIPKASGTTVKEIISGCYRKIRTEMIKPPSSLELFDDKKVLNLDLSTPGACRAARDMGAADRGVADVFISQLGRQGAGVFSEYHMGRAFTVVSFYGSFPECESELLYLICFPYEQFFIPNTRR